MAPIVARRKRQRHHSPRLRSRKFEFDFHTPPPYTAFLCVCDITCAYTLCVCPDIGVASVSALQELVLTLETKAETVKPARWIDLSDARRTWNRIILPQEHPLRVFG
jgi:hypothetical protein